MWRLIAFSLLLTAFAPAQTVLTNGTDANGAALTKGPLPQGGYDYTNSKVQALAVDPTSHALLLNLPQQSFLNTQMFSDVSAGSVVRGDVIVGNSTPKWGRLALGANGAFLGSNGTDAAWLNSFPANGICSIMGYFFAGSPCYANIQAALNALPATGGTVWTTPGYSETLSTNITIPASVVKIHHECPATINMGGANQVVMASGKNTVTIEAGCIHGQTSAVNAGVVYQGYTGAGAVFSIGDSSANTSNFHFRGIAISLDTGALANAVGLLLTNIIESKVEYPWCTMGAISGQVCFETNGSGGALFSGIINIEGAECNSAASATNNTCIKGLGTSNNINIFGGHFNGGGSANGSVGVDINGTTSNGWDIQGFDCDVDQTCLTVESTAVTAVTGFIRQDSGSTNCCTFIVGSSGSHIETNSNNTVTDNSSPVANSVWNPARWQMNTRYFQLSTLSTGVLLNDVPSGVSRLVMVAGAGGNTRLNANGSGGITYANFDTGDSGFGVCTGSGSANNCGRFKSEAATSEKIIAIPNSNLVLPFNLLVTADFVTAANTNLQTITGLSWVMPANTARNQAFDCYLMYSQQTAAVANDAFGIQAASLAPTQINAQGKVQLTAGPPSTYQDGTLTGLTTTTATAIITFTDSAITTIFNAELHGMIENPSGVANTINIMVKTGTAADTMTVKRGSYCLIH